ncbi:hypothetical protein [Phenylobacterium sp.]|uniref:hypothetical protein n=1 Tax=Phenylobacterium sp. TaxID=1871053 RepID=UPI0030F471B7
MSNLYWLTFRIAQVGNHTARYDGLTGAVGSIATMPWWVEPTSFILFQAQQNIDEVAAIISGEIDVSTDLALLGMPLFKSARAIGAITDQDLFKMMPFTKWA